MRDRCMGRQQPADGVFGGVADFVCRRHFMSFNPKASVITGIRGKRGKGRQGGTKPPTLPLTPYAATSSRVTSDHTNEHPLHRTIAVSTDTNRPEQ